METNVDLNFFLLLSTPLWPIIKASLYRLVLHIKLNSSSTGSASGTLSTARITRQGLGCPSPLWGISTWTARRRRARRDIKVSFVMMGALWYRRCHGEKMSISGNDQTFLVITHSIAHRTFSLLQKFQVLFEIQQWYRQIFEQENCTDILLGPVKGILSPAPSAFLFSLLQTLRSWELIVGWYLRCSGRASLICEPSRY